jgi:hypothetical protein
VATAKIRASLVSSTTSILKPTSIDESVHPF